MMTTPTSAIVLASEIMTPDVVTVTVETPIDEIARLLFAHRITGMPVVDDRGAVAGVVSELDVISKTGSTAGDIMSREVISVDEGTAAEEVAHLLSARGVRRVPVLREGYLVGIISRSDLVRLFTITRWACADCGYFVRGFHRPEHCDMCGSRDISLDREPPGM